VCARILVALVLILCCVSTPDRAFLAFVGYGVIVTVLIIAARIPPRLLAIRLGVVGVFCSLAAVGPLWPGNDAVDWSRVAAAAAKALLSAATLIWLLSSAGFARVLAGLDQLHVPRLFTTLIGTTYRYAFLLVAEARRMKRAADSRGYRGRWLWQARTIGGLIGNLFLRSYERGERVHAAMLCRGYTGRPPAVATAATTASVGWHIGDWLLIGGISGAAILLRFAT